MNYQSGPEIIDMLIVMDGESMVDTLRPGTMDQPTVVPTKLIYMIAKDEKAVFGQASKELKITATTGDILRWRASSLSLNSAYQVLLYKYFALRGDDLLSPPVALIVDEKSPLPNPSAPTKPTIQTYKDHFWQATVLSPGEVTYAFQFMVMDREGDQLGYYYWDPFIQIT